MKTVRYSSAASPRGPRAVWASPAPQSGPVFALRVDSGVPGRWASGPGEPGALRAESPAAQPLPGVCPQYRHRPPGPDFLAHHLWISCHPGHVRQWSLWLSMSPSTPLLQALGLLLAGPCLLPPHKPCPSPSTPVQLNSTRAWKRPCPLSPPPPDFSAPSQASDVASWEVVPWRTALTLAHSQASCSDL